MKKFTEFFKVVGENHDTNKKIKLNHEEESSLICLYAQEIEIFHIIVHDLVGGLRNEKDVHL